MVRLILIFLAFVPLAACSNESVADKEAKPATIKVASIPSGATVLMQGAKIGTTPMEVTVRQTTPVELELKGYKNGRLFVDPAGKMNLIANLEALPAPAPKATPSRSGAPTTIRKLKEQYRAGDIDKIEYRRLVTKLKNRMKTELTRLKQAYKRGDIDKVEYQRRAQKIKYRYKG